MSKRYSQKEGLDYHETFLPIAKMVILRSLIALAESKGWNVYQMNVYNVFLQGDLYEKVYIEIPQGFRRHREINVCNLVKSLYGLKQASR